MLACPRCGSVTIFTRQRSNTRYCSVCGYEGKAEEFEFDDSTPPHATIHLRCPKCGSRSVYTRARTKQRVCRRCGYKGDMKEFIDGE